MSPAPTLDLKDLGPDFVRDPYPVYAALRAEGPVHHVRTPKGEELWLIVGHEACRSALVDPRLTRDLRKVDPALHPLGAEDAESPALTHMLLRDAPDHTRLRRLVAREFSPRRIAALAPRIQRITDELLDAMLADGAERADLVAALCFPLPMTVICELLGVPAADRDAFHAWTNEIVAPTDENLLAGAYRNVVDYLRRLIAAKREHPEEDLLSGLVHTVDEEGDRLSGDELIGMALLLLIAGHETTVNLIGNGLRALFAHPDQLELLRTDPEGLIDGAVEEMLRYDGPVETALPRWTTEPVTIGDTRIPAGAVVLVALADADRDPARFTEPDRFTIRRDARGHIAFGHGLHYCLGAPLARLEGRIAVRTLLERCPGLALDADEAQLPWVPGLLIRGVRTLPVRWAR
ncbi:cytochrome P450 family protein [Streptomyces cavernicola]|uniref:Cytochrome P450 n=1 Tax=Streptomyces cavernicola TaxID=3043613 RepID=A0ABT6S4H9_9ACTN|nr:cytochrome P450 [Streptomyces sp. B-S-A6]MDI3402973.1 cytochrome P450 [Streptomyces sp. B-S-A6]